MKKDINIMYVHGLNSDGNSITGKTMERVLQSQFPDMNINVFRPTFPKTGPEALNVLNKEIRKNKINIVIGTSLGGFVTLNAHGPFRIVVNPAMHPSKTLLKLGEPEEVAATYKDIEEKLYSNIDFEDKAATIGWFADNDKVVQNGGEFKKLYGRKREFHGEHRMDERAIKDIIVRSIREWITMCENGTFEDLTYFSNINNLLLD